MLENEDIQPEKIDYDRPSDKLIKFLKRYYNLKDYIPQNNNYVIFNEYFLNKQPNNEGYEDEVENNTNFGVQNFRNTKNTISNWNMNHDFRNQTKPRTLASTSSMVNLKTKILFPSLLISNFN